MATHWFVAGEQSTELDPPQVFFGAPPESPVTGSQRTIDSSCDAAAATVLDEFVDWYIESLKPYWTVDTMDFVTLIVWAFDQPPDLDALAALDDADALDDTACGKATWQPEPDPDSRVS